MHEVRGPWEPDLRLDTDVHIKKWSEVRGSEPWFRFVWTCRTDNRSKIRLVTNLNSFVCLKVQSQLAPIDNKGTVDNQNVIEELKMDWKTRANKKIAIRSNLEQQTCKISTKFWTVVRLSESNFVFFFFRNSSVLVGNL